MKKLLWILLIVLAPVIGSAQKATGLAAPVPSNNPSYKKGVIKVKKKESTASKVDPVLPNNVYVDKIIAQLPDSKVPTFPGGEDGLKYYLERNLKSLQSMPDSLKRSGIVYAQFTVGITGEIRNSIIVKGLNKEIDNEVLRIINSMPPWAPARALGNSITSTFTLPVKISYK